MSGALQQFYDILEMRLHLGQIILSEQPNVSTYASVRMWFLSYLVAQMPHVLSRRLFSSAFKLHRGSNRLCMERMAQAAPRGQRPDGAAIPQQGKGERRRRRHCCRQRVHAACAMAAVAASSMRSPRCHHCREPITDQAAAWRRCGALCAEVERMRRANAEEDRMRRSEAAGTRKAPGVALEHRRDEQRRSLAVWCVVL